MFRLATVSRLSLPSTHASWHGARSKHVADVRSGHGVEAWQAARRDQGDGSVENPYASQFIAFDVADYSL